MKLAHGILGIAGSALAVLAIVSLVLAAYLARQSLYLTPDVIEGRGEVVGYRESRASDGRNLFTPRVRFTTGNGSIHEFEGQLTLPGQPYAIGSTVRVRYLASTPQVARLGEFAAAALGVTVATVLGVLCALAAWLLRRAPTR
ncbi:MAG: DUF3592 domain-containing protein [Steroidobacteraceae bacterium]